MVLLLLLFLASGFMAMQITPGTTYHRFSIKRKLHVILASECAENSLSGVGSKHVTNIAKAHLIHSVVFAYRTLR